MSSFDFTPASKLIFNNMKLYHSTNPKNVANIQNDGLKINQASAHTKAGEWADEIYGMRPVYVSTQPGTYQGTALEIDGDDLILVADLPGLVDVGANISDNNDGFWWEEGNEPAELLKYLDEDGFMTFDALLEPNGPATLAAISLTKTGAVLHDIPPELISVPAQHETR